MRRQKVRRDGCEPIDVRRPCLNEDAAIAAPLLVACLCAAWCRTCDEYRATFVAAAQAFGPQTRFVWVDIEDNEQVLDALEVEDFPTLLIAQDNTINFFGPVTPHVQTTRQLVQRALQCALGEVADTTLEGLPARARALPDVRDLPG